MNSITAVSGRPSCFIQMSADFASCIQGFNFDESVEVSRHRSAGCFPLVAAAWPKDAIRIPDQTWHPSAFAFRVHSSSPAVTPLIISRAARSPMIISLSSAKPMLFEIPSISADCCHALSLASHRMIVA